MKTPAHISPHPNSVTKRSKVEERYGDKGEVEGDLARIIANDDVEVGSILELLTANEAEIARLDAVLAVRQQVLSHISDVIGADAEFKRVLRDN